MPFYSETDYIFKREGCNLHLQQTTTVICLEKRKKTTLISCRFFNSETKSNSDLKTIIVNQNGTQNTQHVKMKRQFRGIIIGFKTKLSEQLNAIIS